MDGVRHHYGFYQNAARFDEEWLYRWPKGQKQTLFHRNHLDETPWYFGRELGGARKLISEATRDNALFLSTAAHLKHPDLGEVAAALVDGWRPQYRIEFDGYPVYSSDTPLLMESNRQTLQGLLRAAGTGGRDFATIRTLEMEPVIDALRRTLRPEILDDVISGLEAR